MQSGTSAIETNRQQENIFEIPNLCKYKLLWSPQSNNNLLTSFNLIDTNFVKYFLIIANRPECNLGLEKSDSLIDQKQTCFDYLLQ